MAENERTLTPGQSVFAEGFGQPFEVIEGPDRSGRYLVGRGSVTLRVHQTQLRASDPPNNPPKNARQLKPQDQGPERISVDLHGLRVEEAIREITATLDRALLQGTREVEIVHGRGTGKIKQAVHNYLKGADYIRSFTINPYNPGSTTVLLLSPSA